MSLLQGSFSTLDICSSEVGQYHQYRSHPYSDPSQCMQWSESQSSRSISPCDDQYTPPHLYNSTSSTLQELSVVTHQPLHTFTRVTKRRTTANKKERRRTQSINTAFAELRECIPNVPSDTKLSKIKTLRLATSYIAYLMGVLADEQAGQFRAELLQPTRRTTTANRNNNINVQHQQQQQIHHPIHQQQQQQLPVHVEQHHLLEQQQMATEHNRRCADLTAAAERKNKGRTGWPQHVWALELKP